MAAQTNAHLETGDVAVLSFEPVCIAVLRERWLDHHEHVLRSSVHTVGRYRTATKHLLDFLEDVRPVRRASAFGSRDAESFARHRTDGRTVTKAERSRQPVRPLTPLPQLIG